MSTRSGTDDSISTKRHASSSSRFYDILGVSPQASDAEVRSAYRRRALATHPDKPGGDALTFRLLIEAYEAIANSRASVPSKTGRRHMKKQQSQNVPQSSSYSSKDPFATDSSPRNSRPSDMSNRAHEVPAASDVPSPTPKAPLDGTKCSALGHAEDCILEFLQACDKSWVAKISKLSFRELEALVAATQQKRSPSGNQNRKTKCRGKSLSLGKRDEDVVDGGVVGAENVESSDSDIESVQAEMLALCDAEDVSFDAAAIGSSPNLGSSQAPSSCKNQLQRGIHYSHKTGKSSYVVTVGFQNFHMVTQCMHSLEEAVDAHIALTQVRSLTLAGLNRGLNFDEVVQESMTSVFPDLEGTKWVKLFLSRLRFAFALRHKGCKYYSPLVSDLQIALGHRRRLLDLKAADAGAAAFQQARIEMRAQKMEAAGGRVRDHGSRNRKTNHRAAAAPRNDAAKLKNKLHITLKKEFKRQQDAFKKRFGKSSVKLPASVDGLMQGEDALLFARLETLSGATIYGPHRSDLRSVLSDHARLQHVQQNLGGDNAARAEASRMDLEAAMLRFQQSLK